MRTRCLIIVAASVVLGPVAGCGLIGGIEEITLVEATADAGTDDADVDAAAVCELPGDGDAFLRLGVVAPSPDAFDFCIKPSGTSFDDIRPLFASGGAGCPAGLRYKDVTVAFREKAGTYDVRMVSAGSQDCTTSEGEVGGVVAEVNRVATVMVFSDSGGHMLRAMPESPIAFSRSQVRFVHAMLGYDTLDCGATNSTRLPATIATDVFLDAPYAGVAPASISDAWPIDANGYLTYSFAGGTLRFAAAPAGQTDAFVTIETRFALNSSHSLFAIGRIGDSTYPPSLWSCDESASEGIYALCGNPLDLSVEVFSTQLTDLFTPLYRERIAPVSDALQHATSDVICVNEIRSPQHLEALLEATAKAYPNSVAAFEVTTSESDLTDQTGVLPPPYATPACTGEAAIELEALMTCIAANCAVDDGTGHHFKDDGNVGADCVANKCSAQATPLLLGDTDKQACWMCALTQMAGEESTEWVTQACSEDPEARYAYRGSVGLAVLSKHPIGTPKSWLLPSTGWQRGVLAVPIDLPNGVPLDFYCSDLTVPEGGILFPYVGHYGAGKKGDDQWLAEQFLQAQRVIGIIDENSGASGARVVLGITAYAGPAYTQGATTLAAQSPEVYDALTAAFNSLVPPGYEPTCTQCIDNPVFSGLAPGDVPAADAWTSHLLGRGIPSDAVKSTEVTFRDAAYDVVAPEGNRTIPPSPQYGLRSLVRITQ